MVGPVEICDSSGVPFLSRLRFSKMNTHPSSQLELEQSIVNPDVADLLCESSRVGPEWADSNDARTSARKSPAVRFSRRQPLRLSRLDRDAGGFLVPSDVKQVCNIGVNLTGREQAVHASSQASLAVPSVDGKITKEIVAHPLPDAVELPWTGQSTTHRFSPEVPWLLRSKGAKEQRSKEVSGHWGLQLWLWK